MKNRFKQLGLALIFMPFMLGYILLMAGYVAILPILAFIFPEKISMSKKGLFYKRDE